MSMYNICCGTNAHSDRLYEMLNLGDYETGRYRDISLHEGKIILLTRNGGGNREHYEHCFESMRTHPNYIDDWDCDWDSTYAEIAFSIPEKFAADISQMKDDKDPGEKFDNAIKLLSGDKK
jgi:hypothetical protein